MPTLDDFGQAACSSCLEGASQTTSGMWDLVAMSAEGLEGEWQFICFTLDIPDPIPTQIMFDALNPSWASPLQLVALEVWAKRLASQCTQSLPSPCTVQSFYQERMPVCRRLELSSPTDDSLFLLNSMGCWTFCPSEDRKGCGVTKQQQIQGFCLLAG